MGMNDLSVACFITLIAALSPTLLVAYKTICYGAFNGTNNRRCFSNAPPFDGFPVPADPYGEIAPTFYLFRQSPNSYQIINSSSDMNLTNGLVIMSHGWMGNFLNTLVWHRPIMENLFVIMPQVEILFVEWEKGASLSYSTNPYDTPASNTRSIAVALVDFLMENNRFNASDCHCVGFSLGSHVCGFAGKWLKAAGFKMGWGRLSALDPAWPSFDVDNPNARIDKTDAEFVDVIHTSRLGLHRPLGDIDFFVSGSVAQPGCRRRRRRNLIDWIDWATQSYQCSHVRAPLIFAQTIIAQPNYNLSGVISDVTRPGTGSCTFSKFCPCPSLEEYHHGGCRKCEPESAQIIGYWSFMRPNRGSFYGELTAHPPYCVEA